MDGVSHRTPGFTDGELLLTPSGPEPRIQKTKLLVFDLQGCHEFSSELYQCLRTRVASEHFYFWLNSLKEFSQAEQCLSHVEDGDYSGAMSAIAEALRSYQKGIASLTVS